MERERLKGSNSAPGADAESRQPIMSLCDFTGLRGGQIKTSVDNLSVYPGDWITIIGANGAGKSSLLLAIMRLIPIKGSCWIDGVKGSKIEQIAQQVGFVFQNRIPIRDEFGGR